MPDKSPSHILDAQSLIAGVIGVIISLFYRRHKSWKTALIGFITGSAAVWFAAPPLNTWLESSPQTGSLISFILGLCAVKLTESIVKDPFGVVNWVRGTIHGDKVEKPGEKEK